MEINPNKTLSVHDLYNRFGRKNELPVEFDSSFHHKLRANLLTGSTNQAYSCCVEYISKWFYSKFPDGFWVTTNIQTSHPLAVLKATAMNTTVDYILPAVSIRADLDFNFNREYLDMYNLGSNTYNNRCSYRDSFFRDYEHNMFISLNSEMLLVNFEFQMVLLEKGIQLDISKMCQMVFRANGSQKHFVDVDYYVPTELIEAIASDAGYTIDKDDFLSITTFLNYLNKNSRLPFLYKLNLSTGNMEWFIKMTNVYVHIKTEDMSLEQGDMVGQKTQNYTVRFNCQVRFPSIKFFAYYTLFSKDTMSRIVQTQKYQYNMALEDVIKIPNRNQKGWNWFANTEYVFNEPHELELVKQKKLGLYIDFEELIGTLRQVIDYTKSIAISPDVFLDIRVYNFDRMVKSHIDWQEYRICIDEPVESAKCILIIYIDTQYFNENLSKLRDFANNRVQPGNKIQPDDGELKIKQLDNKYQ